MLIKWIKYIFNKEKNQLKSSTSEDSKRNEKDKTFPPVDNQMRLKRQYLVYIIFARSFDNVPLIKIDCFVYLWFHRRILKYRVTHVRN